MKGDIKLKEQNRKGSTKTIVLTGMFAAVLAILSQISIPMPSGVPVTLQTFAAALTGCVLGWKLGTASILVYLLLGGMGAPVFAGFRGGVGILLGKTGGFLLGFLLLGMFCGLAAAVKRKTAGIVLAAFGLVFCHLLGIFQFSVLSELPFAESALLVSVPYLIKDGISLVLAFSLGTVLKKALNASDLLKYVRA